MIFIFEKIDRFNTSIRLPVVLAVDSAALEKCSTVLDESEYDIAKYIVNRLFPVSYTHLRAHETS